MQRSAFRIINGIPHLHPGSASPSMCWKRRTMSTLIRDPSFCANLKKRVPTAGRLRSPQRVSVCAVISVSRQLSSGEKRLLNALVSLDGLGSFPCSHHLIPMLSSLRIHEMVLWCADAPPSLAVSWCNLRVSADNVMVVSLMDIHRHSAQHFQEVM